MTGCSVLAGTDASIRDSWNAGVPGLGRGWSSDIKIAASRKRTTIKRSIFCARWRFARRKESRSRLFKLINFPPWKLDVSLAGNEYLLVTAIPAKTTKKFQPNRKKATMAQKPPNPAIKNNTGLFTSRLFWLWLPCHMFPIFTPASVTLWVYFKCRC